MWFAYWDVEATKSKRLTIRSGSFCLHRCSATISRVIKWRIRNAKSGKTRASFSIVTVIGDCAKLLRDNGDGIYGRDIGPRFVRFSLQLSGNIEMPDLSWTVDAISLQVEMP